MSLKFARIVQLSAEISWREIPIVLYRWTWCSRSSLSLFVSKLAYDTPELSLFGLKFHLSMYFLHPPCMLSWDCCLDQFGYSNSLRRQVSLGNSDICVFYATRWDVLLCRIAYFLTKAILYWLVRFLAWFPLFYSWFSRIAWCFSLRRYSSFWAIDCDISSYYMISKIAPTTTLSIKFRTVPSPGNTLWNLSEKTIL